MKNAIIVAGPNGVGKTTFAEKYLDVHALEYISADKIALKLNPEDPSKVRVLAGKLFFQEIETVVLSAGNPFNKKLQEVVNHYIKEN